MRIYDNVLLLLADDAFIIPVIYCQSEISALNSKLKSCCELSVNNIIALNVNLRELSFKGIESAIDFALMENAHSDAGLFIWTS